MTAYSIFDRKTGERVTKAYWFDNQLDKAEEALRENRKEWEIKPLPAVPSVMMNRGG